MRGPPIEKVCGFCKKTYMCPKHREHKSLFCSAECHNANQTSRSVTKDIACQKCGTLFNTKMDHGKWPKFCSKACKNKDVIKPTHKECPTCGGKFLATYSSHNGGGLRIYCSRKCHHQAPGRGVTRVCVCCGKDFYLSPSVAPLRPDDGCCSAECAKEFYILDRNHNWKGGEYVDETTGSIRVLLERPGFSSKYIGKHRVVAAKEIGRLLLPEEKVLHINNQKQDNRPENLFICGTNSEMLRRLQGSLPWPKISNLSTYK